MAYQSKTKRLGTVDEDSLTDTSVKYPFELVIKRTGHFYIHKTSLEDYEKNANKKGYDFAEDLAKMGYVIIAVSKIHSLILF